MLNYKDNKGNNCIIKINNDDIHKNIKLCEMLLKNDVFEKYKCKIDLEGEIIICKDKSKSKNFINKIKKESYEEYLNIISNYNIEKDKWIYNIIDKI